VIVSGEAMISGQRQRFDSGGGERVWLFVDVEFVTCEVTGSGSD
jgi:hypothetical protein